MRKRFIKDGVFYQDPLIVGDSQIYNPTEQQLIDAGYTEYVQSDAEKLDEAKRNILAVIDMYDKSDEVNIVNIHGVDLWLDSDERSALTRRFRAEKNAGVENTTLWWHTHRFDLKVDDAIEMLQKIELYACECYDVTQQHKMNVQNMKTVDEVESYCFTCDYPKKLLL